MTSGSCPERRPCTSYPARCGTRTNWPASLALTPTQEGRPGQTADFPGACRQHGGKGALSLNIGMYADYKGNGYANT